MNDDGEEQEGQEEPVSVPAPMPAPMPAPIPAPPGLREPVHQVSRRAIGYWTVHAVLGAVVVLAAETLLAVLNGFPAWCWAILAATALLSAARAAVMPRWRYRVHRWEVTDQALYTRAGWFTVRWRIAPISRIQTIDSNRSLGERLFGLANVTATTASAAGHIRIHGLDLATADRLQADLAVATARIPGDAT
jgi:uncharacterized protein